MGVCGEKHINAGINCIGEIFCLVNAELTHDHDNVCALVSQVSGMFVDQSRVLGNAVGEFKPLCQHVVHIGNDVRGKTNEADLDAINVHHVRCGQKILREQQIQYVRHVGAKVDVVRAFNFNIGGHKRHDDRVGADAGKLSGVNLTETRAKHGG